MSVVILLLRLALAGVFVLAAATKVADLDGFRKAIREFGAPEWAIVPLAVLVPTWELTGSALLLISPTALLGAALILALLIVLSSAIVFNLQQGRTPDCHCFGQVSSEPIGAATLIRNGLLSAAAVVVLVAGRGGVGPDLFAWTVSLTNAERAGLVLGVLGVALLAAQAWLLVRMNTNQQRLAERLLTLPAATVGPPEAAVSTPPPAGLPVGSPAPEFRLPGLEGAKVSLQDLLKAGKTSMLLFISPTCGPCLALAPDVARWQEDYDPALQFVLVSTGSSDDNRTKAAEHGLTQVLLQKKFEIGDKYQVAGTPSAVLIAPDGTIASPLAQGADEIRALLDQYVEQLAAQAGITLVDEGESERALRRVTSPFTLGAPAPDVSFRGLMGETLTLANFRGRNTALLFWDAWCPHCQEMEADLEAWERERPSDAPDLVIVVPGWLVPPKKIAFRSPIVIDHDERTTQAFHADFTPVAVLIDAEGRIASQPAIGAEPIFRLLGRTPAQREKISA